VGRVSRILKSPHERPRPNPIHPNPGLRPSDEDLPRLVSAWPQLPQHFRQTIMSLVEMVEGKNPARAVKPTAAAPLPEAGQDPRGDGHLRITEAP